MYHLSYFRPPVAYNLIRLKSDEALLDQEFFGAKKTNIQEEAELEIAKIIKPKVWNVYVTGNEELNMETGFEKFIFLVQEHTTVDIDTISLFRFYSLLDHIKDKEENGRRDTN